MKTNLHPHLSDSIIMVPPRDFGFNSQTGVDNHFQQHLSLDKQSIRVQAMQEFDTMVRLISEQAIKVTLFNSQTLQPALPDAVFPNNWFSTRSDGSLIIYPMKTPNRQAEVQVQALSQQLIVDGFAINKTLDLRHWVAENKALEGTGSIVFHHPSQQIYASLSERCDKQALEQFADSLNYQLNAFSSQCQGAPIYHTNVLMSCGEKFAVITADCLVNKAESKRVLDSLYEHFEELIIINQKQMAKHFCGNILQLKSRQGEPLIILSGSAYQGFSRAQMKQIEKHGSPLVCEIPTIETIGGGSARCMIAENFLPEKAD